MLFLHVYHILLLFVLLQVKLQDLYEEPDLLFAFYFGFRVLVPVFFAPIDLVLSGFEI